METTNKCLKSIFVCTKKHFFHRKHQHYSIAKIENSLSVSFSFSIALYFNGFYLYDFESVSGGLKIKIFLATMLFWDSSAIEQVHFEFLQKKTTNCLCTTPKKKNTAILKFFLLDFTLLTWKTAVSSLYTLIIIRK